MTCPICLAKADNNKNWVRCKRYGMPVCERHCSSCEYHSGWETSVVRCYYGRKISAGPKGAADKENPC